MPSCVCMRGIPRIMRAYELIKESLLRRRYLWIVHLVWLCTYAMFWWLFLPDPEEFGNFVFNWGGLFLALALSAGILGDDIASGRICVIMTRPLRPASLCAYRLLGLSLQGALHFVLAWGVLFIMHVITGKGSVEGFARWFVVTWLFFNTWAALSLCLSVIVKRAHNSLLLFVLLVTVAAVVGCLQGQAGDLWISRAATGFARYACPPFKFLHELGEGKYVGHTLTVARRQIPKHLACAAHTLLLCGIYLGIGMRWLSRREFFSERE